MDKDITEMIKTQVKTAKTFSIEIPLDKVVKVQHQGERHKELLYRMRDFDSVIRKISKDEYVDIRTGEIKKYERKEEKTRKNLIVTFRGLSGRIRAHFDTENNGKQLFITLTYAENMQDYRQLYTDWDAFWKRLKYYMRGHNLDYIAVAEPQERGAWHYHVMLKSDKYLFIPKEKMTELWGHGYTTTEDLKSDDVGRYYVAYFTDLFGELGEKAKKKKARLHMYPVGMKFYRCSRGITAPKDEEMLYSEVIERWGKPEHTSTILIDEIKSDDYVETQRYVQLVQREHYKVEVDKSPRTTLDAGLEMELICSECVHKTCDENCKRRLRRFVDGELLDDRDIGSDVVEMEESEADVICAECDVEQCDEPCLAQIIPVDMILDKAETWSRLYGDDEDGGSG